MADRKQQASYQMENKAREGRMPKFVADIRRDKGALSRMGVALSRSTGEVAQRIIPRWHIEDVRVGLWGCN